MATILVTTDRAPSRSYLVMLLKHQGHRVVTADNSALALETIHGAHPDLVLVDTLLPPPGAYQLVRRLRNQTGRVIPPVVLLAAPSMQGEARLLAKSCGISHIVTDICDPETMLAIIESALPDRSTNTTPAHVAGNAFYRMVGRLYRRVAELETVNTRLARYASAGAEQLQVARSALDREIFKRLFTEQQRTPEKQKLQVQEAQTQSVRDPLTGLYNRNYLDESLAREVSLAKRNGQSLGMMMLDIDQVERCHDSYGHAACEAMLRAVSRYMQSLARSEDILCRYSGEAFVLVMTNTAPALLRQRANSLRASLPKLHIEHEQRQIGPVTLSIGLAIFPDSGDSATAVLQAADAALCQAKNSGPDRIVGVGLSWSKR